MKRTALSLFFICFSALLGFSAEQASGHSIKVRVKGLEPQTVKLAYHFGDKKMLQDSAQVDNKGWMTFSDEAPLKRGIYMVILPDQYFEFIISDSQQFTLETEVDDKKTDASETIQNMKVTGSEENQLFYEYLKYITPLGRETGKLSECYKEKKDSENKKEKQEAEDCKAKALANQESIEEYKKNFIKQHPNTFVAKLFLAMQEVEVPDFKEIKDDKERNKRRYYYYKSHFLDNIDLTEAGLLRTPILEPKLNQYITELTPQQTDSVTKVLDEILAKMGNNKEGFKYVVATYTSHYEKSNIMCTGEGVAYHMFTNYYLGDPRCDWIDATTKEKITDRVNNLKYNRCGLAAPDLNMPDTNGVKKSLSQIKAEYTVIYFWSATCGHCKKATPKLYENVYKRFKDYGLEIYSVHIDRQHEDKYRKFIKDNGLDWINVSDPNAEVPFRWWYDIYSTPVIYVLDKNKKIIAKRIDVPTLEKMMEDKLMN